MEGGSHTVSQDTSIYLDILRKSTEILLIDTQARQFRKTGRGRDFQTFSVKGHIGKYEARCWHTAIKYDRSLLQSLTSRCAPSVLSQRFVNCVIEFMSVNSLEINTLRGIALLTARVLPRGRTQYHVLL